MTVCSSIFNLFNMSAKKKYDFEYPQKMNMTVLNMFYLRFIVWLTYQIFIYDICIEFFKINVRI